MTGFAILGSSGLAFRIGIVYLWTDGVVHPGSSSRLDLLHRHASWALGKKFGFMTPVQIFRDRWGVGHIGTVIFAGAGACCCSRTSSSE